MATVKVFSAQGVKELSCFDTLDNVPYLEDEIIEEDVPKENNPFE